MIAEAANYIATLALSGRKSPAEINASIRLWARARRCGTDWAEHEARCHRAVMAAIARLPSHRTVAVLGSGLLRDIPIIELSARFQRVLLCDLQHLASIRIWRRIKGLSNLDFLHTDLSAPGGAQAASPGLPDPLAFLDRIEDLDLIISANIASQIGIGVKRAMKDKAGDDAEAARLVGAHLGGLWRRRTAKLLLTDTDYRIRDRDGAILESGELLFGIDPGPSDDSWDWLLAPFGEADPGYEVIHRAMARLVIPPRSALSC